MSIVISVIIPTFNIENYILKCLESLKNQTLSQDLFEVIVIDDESTDKTLQFVKGFNQLKNLKVIVPPINRGPGIARNKGIEIAEGKYILFLDGDDYLKYNALETIYKNMNDGSDCIVYNWAYSDDIKTPRKRDFPYISTNTEKFIKNYLGMTVSGDVIYTVTKKELFEKYNISFPGGYHEDMLIIFKIFYLSSKIKKLTRDILYLKTDRQDSIIRTLTFKHIDGYLGSWPDIMKFLIKQEGESAIEYLPFYLRGINGLVYTLIYKNLHIYKDDMKIRKNIYEYIYSVLQKDKFINNKNFEDFPKETKKDQVAQEYYRLMSEDNLNYETLLSFENKILQNMM